MAPLIDWMQNEYLTQLLVRRMRPKPGRKLPRGEVTIEWGERSNDSLQLYRLRAEKVTRWSLEGEWNENEPVEWVVDPPTDAPIALHMKVPGLLVLECGQLTVEPGKVVRYRDPTPVAPDPTTFLVWGPRELTWNAVLGWIEPPAGVRLYEQMPGDKGNRLLSDEELAALIKAPCTGMYRLQAGADAERPWLWVQWGLCITVVGHYLSLQRGALDGAAWARALRLPRHLDPCTVFSGTVRCDAEEWLARWVPRLVGAADPAIGL